LGALLSITASNLSEDEYKILSNLPSRVFYGVNSDAAIALRLLGVPRTAATALTNSLAVHLRLPLTQVRVKLRELSEDEWKVALGESGRVYRSVWRILKGLPFGPYLGNNAKALGKGHREADSTSMETQA
jgi:hypothetical protein